MNILHCPRRQACSAAATGRQEIPVELCYLGWTNSLEAQPADARFDVPVDQVTVVLERLRLDLDSVSLDPRAP